MGHNHNSMSHPRVEEVTDSSGSDSDPDIIDIDTIVPAPRASQSNNNPTLTPANQIPVTSSRPNPGFDANTAKKWVCLYPVYFDASRSRQEGRRVGKELAVLNPLARTMADACANVGLRVFIDVGKTHPKDWANCGRVKVEMRDEEGRLKSPGVKNKHHLYIHVAKYLQAHPTTPETPFKLTIRGMPMPEKPPEPPVAPRGWKVNAILPLHSPAVTGGGVSENMLNDMMKEMGGAQGGGGSGTSTPGGSKKMK